MQNDGPETSRSYFRKIGYILLLLSPRDRFIIFFSALIITLLGLLDLLGIVLIGLVITISTQNIVGNPISQSLSSFMKVIHLSHLDIKSLVASLAVASASLLIIKTILNILFNKRFSLFLANREAQITSLLFSRLFLEGLDELRSRNIAEYQHSLTLGSTQAITTLLGSSISLISELFLQITLAVGLFLYSPSLFLITTLYFSILAISMSKYLGKKAQAISRRQANSQTDSNSIIYNMIAGFREIRSSGKSKFFVKQFRDSKLLGAKLTTEHIMLGQYSKYIFEIAAVIAALLFAGYSFLTLTAIQAVSALAIFMATSSRIAPSILRLQMIIIQIRGALGASANFLALCEKYKIGKTSGAIPQFDNPIPDLISSHLSRGPIIDIRNLSFRYKGANEDVLSNINLEIYENKQYAIVGKSGAGKSTLIDLILGILEPKNGEICISGISPREFIKNHPGIIQYVPQDIHLFGNSYAENIALGETKEAIDARRVQECLEAVGLFQEISHKKDGIWGSLNDRGTNLSGGQRQRLGIARALYSNPRVLLLDEATSALDSVSEKQIVDIFQKIGNRFTIIYIAHRLSTIVSADKVVFIESGRILETGTFEEVRMRVKEFDEQATLMGL